MAPSSVRAAVLAVLLAGVYGCVDRRRVLTMGDVGEEHDLARAADVYAHQTRGEQERLLAEIAAELSPGSPRRVEVLLRLIDLRLEAARVVDATGSTSAVACTPEPIDAPCELVRVTYERALAVVAILRAEVEPESDARAEVEWRAAVAYRGLALDAETRDALLAVIKEHPQSPRVAEALMAFGDQLWSRAGDEYKMCEAYRRASEHDEFFGRQYALLQLARCSLGYGETETARRAIDSLLTAPPGSVPVNWRCDDLNAAAMEEVERLPSR